MGKIDGRRVWLMWSVVAPSRDGCQGGSEVAEGQAASGSLARKRRSSWTSSRKQTRPRTKTKTRAKTKIETGIAAAITRRRTVTAIVSAITRRTTVTERTIERNAIAQGVATTTGRGGAKPPEDHPHSPHSYCSRSSAAESSDEGLQHSDNILSIFLRRYDSARGK